MSIKGRTSSGKVKKQKQNNLVTKFRFEKPRFLLALVIIIKKREFEGTIVYSGYGCTL